MRYSLAVVVTLFDNFNLTYLQCINIVCLSPLKKCHGYLRTDLPLNPKPSGPRRVATIIGAL